MNINEAVKQANRNSRAQNMQAEGYTVVIYKDWLTVEIHKPGNTTMMQDYMVNRLERTCTCEDAKRGNYCKHQMFVELVMETYPQGKQALEEAQDEAAMWEAICAEYDLRARYEE